MGLGYEPIPRLAGGVVGEVGRESRGGGGTDVVAGGEVVISKPHLQVPPADMTGLPPYPATSRSSAGHLGFTAIYQRSVKCSPSWKTSYKLYTEMFPFTRLAGKFYIGNCGL